MTDNLGLYIHIPFCEKKCAYCDFYSVSFCEQNMDVYVKALIKEIERWGGELKNRPIDTVYLGGGTPSLLKGHVGELITAVKSNFTLSADPEITAELNPESAADFLGYAVSAGVNRISIGAQSGSDETLKSLGRIHTAADTEKAVCKAREAGFENISLDIIIGLPESDIKSLERDIDFVLSMSPEHISAYILKLEKGTPLYDSNTLLPAEDSIAEQYLYMCSAIEAAGYSHYEISNFARPGYESRHNLKYWKTEEYLGIGPAAHSFVNGKRFYYPRDIGGFIANPKTVPDGTGGDVQEKLMLGLRLDSGVDIKELYGTITAQLDQKLKRLSDAGYIEKNGSVIKLTDRGMLLSNSIITELIL